jgi:thiamine-phosphate pyrophosphorylase
MWEREDRRKMVRGLYVIVDPEHTKRRDPETVIREAVAGGATMIQLRDKRTPRDRLMGTARRLRRLCNDLGVLFIVNDYVEVAAVSGADGVHLGPHDTPVRDARDTLAEDVLVGASTNTPAEALKAQSEGADYVAVGRIFPTKSKEDTRPATPRTIRNVKNVLNVPVVAIGGINETNIDLVLEMGADAVAVISAVCEAPDIRAAARRLSDRIEAHRGR